MTFREFRNGDRDGDFRTTDNHGNTYFVEPWWMDKTIIRVEIREKFFHRFPDLTGIGPVMCFENDQDRRNSIEYGVMQEILMPFGDAYVCVELELHENF